jgi:F0F1-type ATP synthase membrane subunit b/b'
MSDMSATPARPVSLFTIVFLFAVFAAFLLVIRYFYQPATLSSYNAAPDNVSKDFEWRATAEARRKALVELRDAEAKKVSGYAWVDQKAGTVQLPIDRAMELTARELAAKQAKK